VEDTVVFLNRKVYISLLPLISKKCASENEKLKETKTSIPNSYWIRKSFRYLFSFDIFIKDEKINIYKENLLIIFTSLPIDKTCCLGLIERKTETDSLQYNNFFINK